MAASAQSGQSGQPVQPGQPGQPSVISNATTPTKKSVALSSFFGGCGCLRGVNNNVATVDVDGLIARIEAAIGGKIQNIREASQREASEASQREASQFDRVLLSLQEFGDNSLILEKKVEETTSFSVVDNMQVKDGQVVKKDSETPLISEGQAPLISEGQAPLISEGQGKYTILNLSKTSVWTKTMAKIKNRSTFLYYLACVVSLLVLPLTIIFKLIPTTINGLKAAEPPEAAKDEDAKPQQAARQPQSPDDSGTEQPPPS